MSDSRYEPKTLRSLLGGDSSSEVKAPATEAASAKPKRSSVQSLAAARAKPAQDSQFVTRGFEPPTPANQDTALLPNVPSPQLKPGGEAPALTPLQPKTPRLRADLPRLPQRRVRRSHGALLSFILFVVLPTALAAIYYVFIASHQYAAEFRFSVKDTSSTARQMSPSSAAPALLGMFGGGAAPNSNENYIVADFLTSKQAVDELQTRINLIDLYARRSVDWWSRFNASLPIERFVNYWQHMIVVQYDQVTGIASAKVRAFTPEDAQLIARTMLTISEELINRIAVRMQSDTVRFAQKEVQRGEDRLREIRVKLTEHRNKTGVIDPSTSLVASNSQLAQTLRANLTQLQTQLAALQAQQLGPSAPAVMTLQVQIKATRDQLAALESNVAKSSQGAALSGVIAQFEQLELERQLAQTMLTSAQQALDQARAVAAAQFLYVEPYVRPSLPESSTYPQRLQSIAMIAFFAFVAWTILLLTVRSIREHYG